jgi:SAM-dependent methyltransferase
VTAHLHQTNAQQYITHKGLLSEYLPTEQYGIVNGYEKGDSVLDIGCNDGRLLKTLRNMHGEFPYIGIDYDPVAVEAGRQAFPKDEWICDKYPSSQLDGRVVDAVYCYQVFPFFNEWKEVMRRMAANARKRIVLDVALSWEYPTLDDPDTSFTYYLGSGQRTPYVVHNVVQFVNYCFTEHVGASTVRIQATRPKTSSTMHGVPQSKLLRGVAVITKDTTGKAIWGAQRKEMQPDFMAKIASSNYRLPEASIEIDGELTSIYPREGIF